MRIAVASGKETGQLLMTSASPQEKEVVGFLCEMCALFGVPVVSHQSILRKNAEMNFRVSLYKYPNKICGEC